MTGYMEPYLDRLKRYAGKVPLVCGNFNTSEGPVAVNINPESVPPHVSFTLVPNLAYYEFLPYCHMPKPSEDRLDKAFAHGKARPDDDYYETVQQPLDISQLKVGEEYEIVPITRGGLYRYRLQDIVRVTSFYKTCPKFEFVSRANVILSMAIDMSREKDLARAVSTASKWLMETSARAIELVDYTSYVDRATDPGHYVIFWELSVSKREEGDFKDTETLRTWLTHCATLLDLTFANIGAAYLLCRQMGIIGALELCVVEEGTFSKLLDSAVRVKEASINQYKVPRLVVCPHAHAMLRDFTY
ncbi:hypothetical protein L7F22_000996 [Adiantum nelumboides]|nr:hypothetical protein [Adiantum nelumboides]